MTVDLASIDSASTGQLLAELSLLRQWPDKSHSHLVARIGLALERRNALKLTKTKTDAIEQVATAALETGHLSLAKTLIARLTAHFREEPYGLHRVNYLAGMLLEAQGDLAAAKEFYQQKLRDDETDVAVRKRLTALHLSSPVVDLPAASSSSSSKPSAVPATLAPYVAASLTQSQGIALLVSYLDTYYLDLSSWLVLSTAYSALAQYPLALTALDHAIVLAPHDPFVQLKYAETAYSAGDVPLAYKAYLRTVEMATEKGTEGEVMNRKGGATRRAVLGAKLCLARLRTATSSDKSSSRSDDDPSLAPKRLDEMDLLLSRLLLESVAAAPGGAGPGGPAQSTKDAMRSWLGGAAAVNVK
ncbi:hypothetical protein BMF94_4863 [Rhodotorula taiwanensis]|uniref:ER membrane protein complex subunit 2 n=1 Tax=Rhodotorula taiwanensis TaxID=741276 RepID=A0A2S5B5Z7_9BASI|nr:hypothetical protein BMF94_4863 [Rhodotorula taiwanensis]